MLVEVFKRIQTGLTSKDTGSPIEGRVREVQGREPRKGMVTRQYLQVMPGDNVNSGRLVLQGVGVTRALLVSFAGR